MQNKKRAVALIGFRPCFMCKCTFFKVVALNAAKNFISNLIASKKL
jgi:hypothetical protein